LVINTWKCFLLWRVLSCSAVCHGALMFVVTSHHWLLVWRPVTDAAAGIKEKNKKLSNFFSFLFISFFDVFPCHSLRSPLRCARHFSKNGKKIHDTRSSRDQAHVEKTTDKKLSDQLNLSSLLGIKLIAFASFFTFSFIFLFYFFFFFFSQPCCCVVLIMIKDVTQSGRQQRSVRDHSWTVRLNCMNWCHGVRKHGRRHCHCSLVLHSLVTPALKITFFAQISRGSLQGVMNDIIDQLIHKQIDPKFKGKTFANWFTASPVAAIGSCVFDDDDAVAMHKEGKKVTSSYVRRLRNWWKSTPW